MMCITITSNHFNIKDARNGLVDQFEKTLMGKHIDMCSSTDKTVHILGAINVEKDVYSMNNLISQNAIYHLPLYFPTIICILMVLYPCRVPCNITILTTTY